MIKHPLNEVCDEVWYRLKYSERLKIRQGEETLTDNILLYLRMNEKRFGRIQIASIKKTPKTAKAGQGTEADQGTDWEWWIGSNRHWRRYAVQAKKLCLQTGCYALKHRVGGGGNGPYQHDILADYAKENEAIPLYAFYNHIRKDAYDDYWHCRQSKFEKSKLGVTVTPLENIPFVPPSPHGYRKFESIHRVCETVPMRCLVCPKYEKIFATSKTYFADSRQMKVREKAKVYPRPPDIFGTERFSVNIDGLPRDFYNHDSGYCPKRIVKIETECQ